MGEIPNGQSRNSAYNFPAYCCAVNNNEILQTGNSVRATVQGQVAPSSRIPVVDDDICIRKISFGVLTTSDYQVDSTEGGSPVWSGIIGMKLLDLLLVDDDHNDCALLRIAIDKSDLKICLQTVTDGDEAIDYLEGRGVYADRSLHPFPALVLLDLDRRLTGGWNFLGSEECNRQNGHFHLQ
jgi:CheY-like chemotaxis protein